MRIDLVSDTPQGECCKAIFETSAGMEDIVRELSERGVSCHAYIESITDDGDMVLGLEVEYSEDDNG